MSNWIAKTIRDWRRGTLLFPSVLLIGLTIAIGFTLPLFPNIDVAFQGFNVWHSLQYLALIWFLMAMRKERGEIDNHFVAEMNGPDRPWRFYGLAVALTALVAIASYIWIYARVLGDPPIRSDGYSYYVYLPAWLLDGDPSLETVARDCCGGRARRRRRLRSRAAPRGYRTPRCSR